MVPNESKLNLPQLNYLWLLTGWCTNFCYWHLKLWQPCRFFPDIIVHFKIVGMHALYNMKHHSLGKWTLNELGFILVKGSPIRIPLPTTNIGPAYQMVLRTFWHYDSTKLNVASYIHAGQWISRYIRINKQTKFHEKKHL